MCQHGKLVVFILLFIVRVRGSAVQVIVCDENRFYDDCGSPCPLRCGEPPVVDCADVCLQGCQCLENYCLETNGNCLHQSLYIPPPGGFTSWPSMSTSPTWNPSTLPITDSPTNKPSASGQNQPSPPGGNPKQSISPSTSPSTTIQCGENAYFDKCGSSCPRECGRLPSFRCDDVCVEACFCDEGFCLNRKGECRRCTLFGKIITAVFNVFFGIIGKVVSFLPSRLFNGIFN